MQTSWIEHFDVVQPLLVGMISVITWFSVRAFNKIDSAQKELFDRMRGIEDKVNHLIGEHDARCKAKMRMN